MQIKTKNPRPRVEMEISKQSSPNPRLAQGFVDRAPLANKKVAR